MAHVGGGASASLHSYGAMCDLVLDDEGPFSAGKSGGLTPVRTTSAPQLPAEDFAEPRGIKVFPFQLSLWSPIQLVPSTTRIIGARVILAYSNNVSIVGLDAGVVGRVSEDILGLQANLINLAGYCRGMQTGVVGFAESIHLLQANAVYNKTDTLWGAQIGVVNTADKCVGTQLGVVNIAGLLRGVQIGLVNIVRYGEQAGFMPFINIRF